MDEDDPKYTKFTIEEKKGRTSTLEEKTPTDGGSGQEEGSGWILQRVVQRREAFSFSTIECE